MVAPALAALAKKSLSRYQAAQKSVEAFQDAFSKTWQRRCQNPIRAVPSSSMIDELDRCRPSYAVELLETRQASVSLWTHIVFVLAVNRSELAHAIRALYGIGF